MEAVGFLRAIIAGAIVLGVLVLVHEWGHFIAAKLCGVRVDVFSIGFGKRLWGVKRGDTDYRVSALPLGGYVRMAGDNPVEERTGAPYEFLSRPRWQRFLIAIAGPAMNILVTLLIFWGIFVLWHPGAYVPGWMRPPCAERPARRMCRRATASFKSRRNHADVEHGAGPGE